MGRRNASRAVRFVRCLTAAGLALLPPVYLIASDQVRRHRDLTRLIAQYKTPKEPRP